MQTRIAALSLGLIVLLELLVWWRLQPPPVAPMDASDASFSAARAEQTVGRLLRPERPHPSGTAELGLVRERLLAELTSLGLAPAVQRGVACNDMFGVCAELANVLAIVPGKKERVRLALLAHYDSVPAGPGAGDDGQGTATLLEIARALRAAPADESVALVFTDGEELGLLGARLFVREHPLVAELDIVINVEARGTRGPSLMFETTPGSAWLVELYAQAAEHPVTSSLFPAVYRTLPNDTDFSIFARRGLQGLNFAFIGGVENYHTPRDSIRNVDFRSVQQQGGTVLGLARRITARGTPQPGADQSFFDVLALGVVRLPTLWLWFLAVASTASFALCALRHPVPGAQARLLLRALGRAVIALVLPALSAWLLALLLGALGALPFFFVATPGPLLGAFLAFAFAGQAWAQSAVTAGSKRLALWDATWCLWLVLGWLLLLLVPGASYVCWVPTAAAALLRPLLVGRSVPDGDGGLRAALLCFGPAIVITLLVWLPLASMLYDAVGFAAPPALALVFALLLAPAAFVLEPLIGTRRRAMLLAALGLSCGVAQYFAVPSTSQSPQRLSLALSVDAQGRAEWIAETTFGPLPSSLAAAAAWQLESSEPFPLPALGRPRVRRAPAEVGARPQIAPVLRRSGPTQLELELSLPQPAWALTLHVHRSRTLARAMFRGQTVQARSEGAWQAITVVPGDERRVVLSLDYDSDVLPELAISEVWLGLPPGSAPLITARGDAAVPSQLGDLTLKWVRLDPQSLQ